MSTWPAHFKAVATGQMLFQVLKDDQNYQPGDALVLREFDPDQNVFTGRLLACVITYKLTGGSSGIEDGYCVAGIYRPISPR